ncbi:MAG: hypothetical protein QOH92_214 [Chloroflexota bacterium]|jgi:hypothetical protein|nr:hypothetical protein [Chloroflexota bacterium]
MAITADERLIGRGALGQFLDDIGEICGTPPRPHIPHIPWLQEVLVGVAISRLVATLDKSEQRTQLQRLSSELVSAAVHKAGSNPMPGIAAEVRER